MSISNRDILAAAEYFKVSIEDIVPLSLAVNVNKVSNIVKIISLWKAGKIPGNVMYVVHGGNKIAPGETYKGRAVYLTTLERFASWYSDAKSNIVCIFCSKEEMGVDSEGVLYNPDGSKHTCRKYIKALNTRRINNGTNKLETKRN